MSKLVLCTGNPGKIAELRALLPSGIGVLSLPDVGMPLELPETGSTLQANALQKARYVHARTGLPCLADDTGLEVEALGGEPGVHSARYAGETKDPAANIAKLLRELEGRTDRRARFRTVVAYVAPGLEHTVEGEVRGHITGSPRGSNGFGYDPVFRPDMSDLTFGELDTMRKNAISHRAQAMWRIVRYLTEGE